MFNIELLYHTIQSQSHTTIAEVSMSAHDYGRVICTRTTWLNQLLTKRVILSSNISNGNQIGLPLLLNLGLLYHKIQSKSYSNCRSNYVST